jgi:hypothetical protein
MIYRICKKVYKTSAGISLLLFYLAASVSDFHVVELGQAEPDSVNTLIVWGVVFLIPMVLYGILKEIARRLYGNE